MKKFLALLSAVALMGNTLPNVIAANNYHKQENNINQENSVFMEEFELSTPVTKAAGFYWQYSDENTLNWTKKLSPETKYTTFIVKGIHGSEGWAEGSSFKTQRDEPVVNLLILGYYQVLDEIQLVNGIQLNNKIISYTWYTNDKKTYTVAKGYLFLDFKFVDNTINVKFTANNTYEVEKM